MPINEWEKSRYGSIGWQKKVDNDYLVSVEQSSRYRDQAYVVKVINHTKLIHTSKKFKMRDDAITYAKGYMRSH
jgi:hypothetical protein